MIMFKKCLVALTTLIVTLVATGIWFFSLLPEPPDHHLLKTTLPKDIPYIQSALPQNRGKILAVVTSTDTLGNTGKATGYEFTELARPYWVFTVNGFEVDIASVKGGKPPVVYDDDDMGLYDYAFLNDKTAMLSLNNSLPIDSVNPEDYHAVFFVGGKGTMFDFPDNLAIQNLVKQMYQAGKVVSGVCHGPAAFSKVTLDNGLAMIANKKISAFTNEEELLLISDAENIFPFLLESQLKLKGAEFIAGPMYLEQVTVDGNLLTGQNPWSTWLLSEEIIKALGFVPVNRSVTTDEHAVELLTLYGVQGLNSAIDALQQKPKGSYNRFLVAQHSLIAIMQLKLIDAIQLIRLTHALKQHDEQ